MQVALIPTITLTLVTRVTLLWVLLPGRQRSLCMLHLANIVALEYPLYGQIHFWLLAKEMKIISPTLEFSTEN